MPSHFFPLRPLVLIALIGLLGCTLTPAAAADPTWTGTGTLVTGRSHHTATLLPSGRVLATGGWNQGFLSSCELYEPASGTWSATGTMATGRAYHCAVLLPSGKLLIIGGGTTAGAMASCELYDVATGVWQSTGAMANARQDHAAVMLTSGQVLTVGGTNNNVPVNSCELYDPATGTWRTIPAMTHARMLPTAIQLASGKVLIAGGHSGADVMAACEIYDPVTNTWSMGPSLLTARYAHTATVLPSGRILAVAGIGRDNLLASCELYDPASGLWSARAPITGERVFQRSTLLPTGMVLTTGGLGYGTGTGASCALYDPSLDTWTTVDPLAVGRDSHSATLLPSGRVLLAGGLESGRPVADCVLSVSYGQSNAAPTVAKAAKATTVTADPRMRTLTVLGADDRGEAGLTYTWEAVGAAPGSVEFTVNASNAAKTTTAWMLAPGTYTFRATITDGDGASVTSSVRVTASPQATSLLVRPDYASVPRLGTVAFRGEVRDQFNSPFSNQAVTWSTTGGGRFLAPGTHVIEASGADIWGTADGFRFVHQELAGDGSIIARLDELENTHAWAKAGLMMREGLGAGARHAMIVLTPGSGASFQRRTVAGGASTSTTVAGQRAPRWLRLTRAGTLVTGATSLDGVAWMDIGSDTIAMAGTIRVGMAVTSHQAGVRARAVFSQVSLSANAATGPLPSGWSNQDIGSVVSAGAAFYTPASATFAITGSGADIWGTRDAGHFVHRPLVGDATVMVRVTSLGNSDVWAKAGLMIRESLAPNARNVLMAITPGSGATLQYRATTGGTSLSSKLGGVNVPQWLKLVRRGDEFTGFVSADAVNWRLIGFVRLALPATVYLGMAVTSHNVSAATAATFEQLQITSGAESLTEPLWPWQAQDVGNVVLTGSSLVATSHGAFLVGSQTGSFQVTATAAGVSQSTWLIVENGAPIISIAPRASASPVTGVTTTLTTYGDDDAGEPGLTYTWSTVGAVPAPVVFSRNGSNAAKSTTATFTAAGTYTFRVTVSDAGNRSTTSEVTVTVAPNVEFPPPLPAANG